MPATALRHPLLLALALVLLELPLARGSGRLMPMLPWGDHNRATLATLTAGSRVQCGLLCALRSDCRAVTRLSTPGAGPCQLLAAAEGEETTTTSPTAPPTTTTAPTTTEAAPLSCDTDWTRLGDACFRLYPDRMGWEASKALCRSARSGAELASIQSAEENQYVKSVLSRSSAFIGLEHTAAASGSYQFRWLLDGSSVSFSHWRQSPVQKPDKDPSKHLCVAALAGEAEWIDYVVKDGMPEYKSLCKYQLV